MNITIKNQKFVKKSISILLSIFSLVSPTFAMKCTKKHHSNIISKKIQVKNLQAFCDNPKIYGIDSEIQILYNSKVDDIVKWIENYNYSGDEFSFYYLLSVTLKYISKIKPNDTLCFLEESYIYKYQDNDGYISLEDFKLCLVSILSKIC